MAITNAEEAYEQIVKGLSAAEQLRLVEKIAHDLAIQPGQAPPTETLRLERGGRHSTRLAHWRGRATLGLLHPSGVGRAPSQATEG